MKANEQLLLEFWRDRVQFTIPIYQRLYSWTDEPCHALWDDLLRIATNPASHPHFIGSVVAVASADDPSVRVPRVSIIDGQQRLTTLMLLMIAIRDALRAAAPEDPIAAEITATYLTNADTEDASRMKLVLTRSDSDTLACLVNGGPIPVDASKQIMANFRFFESRLRSSGVSPAAIYNGLTRLSIVRIELTLGQDHPQRIFESLNATGQELTQSDLVRNFLLMNLEHDVQREVYLAYWHPMEQRFQKAGDPALFDQFLRTYLTMRDGVAPATGKVYAAFKQYAAAQTGSNSIQIAKELAAYGDYFARIALGKDDSLVLARHFADFRTLKMDIAYPFILALYGDYAAGRITLDNFCAILTMVESYLARRMVCGLPSNALSKMFPTFISRLKSSTPVSSVAGAFARLRDKRRFPSNAEFTTALTTHDLYHHVRPLYLLGKLENHGRKEMANLEGLTVEHILPQNPSLRRDWLTMLGPDDAGSIQARYLHTLGNLTLTAFNSQMSDREFTYKRDSDLGFRKSPLYLNDGLRDLQQWTPVEIEARANVLTTRALAVWPDNDAPQGTEFDSTPEDVIGRPTRRPRGERPTATRAERRVARVGREERARGEYRPIAEHLETAGSFAPLLSELIARMELLGPNITHRSVTKYVSFQVPGMTNGTFVYIKPFIQHEPEVYLKAPPGFLQDPLGLCQPHQKMGRPDQTVKIRVPFEQIDDLMTLVHQNYQRLLAQARR